MSDQGIGLHWPVTGLVPPFDDRVDDRRVRGQGVRGASSRDGSLGGQRLMGLAVNASIVDSFVSGLGNYTIYVTKELCRIEHDLLVYTAQPQLFPWPDIRLRPIAAPLGPSHGK
ncbi:MAG: hypothetical protein R3351_06185 [Nitrospirales bacterium]|nr:hypothetical protein [Nitrospirales bacterium]